MGSHSFNFNTESLIKLQFETEMILSVASFSAGNCTLGFVGGEGNICVDPPYLKLAECLPAIKSPLNNGLLCCTFSFVKVIRKAASLAEFSSSQEAQLGSGNVHKGEI